MFPPSLIKTVMWTLGNYEKTPDMPKCSSMLLGVVLLCERGCHVMFLYALDYKLPLVRLEIVVVLKRCIYPSNTIIYLLWRKDILFFYCLLPSHYIPRPLKSLNTQYYNCSSLPSFETIMFAFDKLKRFLIGV